MNSYHNRPSTGTVASVRSALYSMLSGPDFEMPAVSSAPTVPGPSAEVELPDAKAFMLAGKATFTVQGKSSRYTYKVKKSKPSEKYPTPGYFVKVLTGPDNTNDYQYVGILNPTTGVVTPTAKSKYKADTPLVAGLNWITKRVWAKQPLGSAKIFHAGHCGRCGKLLTVPESVESGFGPECITKVGL